MKFFTKEYTDCIMQAYVNLDKTEVNQFFDQILSELQKKVRYPGYRPGKVPFDIIEKSYPDELLNKIIKKIIFQSVEELHNKGIHLYSEPRFKPFSGLNRSSGFSFALTFETPPEVVKNIDIENLSLEFEEFYYDDKMIEFSMLKELKVLQEVKGRIEDEDTVTVKILNENYNGEKETVFSSHVVKTLIGKKTGDKIKIGFEDLDNYVVDFLETINENYLDIEVVKVERPVSQNITDDIVKQLTRYNSADEYKKAILNHFVNMTRDFNERSKKDALTEYIGKNVEIKFPKSEFIRSTRDEVVKFISNNFSNSESSLSNLLKDEKIKIELSDLPKKVYQRILLYFSMKDIANKKEIQPDFEIIDRIVSRRARERELTPEEFKKKCTNDEWNSIKESALFETTINFVLNKATFKAKTKTPIIKTK